jgi:tRNA 2-(methylsulfanyl)-N6-isopentenyladenosine37 hydroxylase
MFALRWATPAEWGRRAASEPLRLLSDHAHCELRAAASAQGLIHRHPSESRLVERLATLALEELEHFRSVHRLLTDAGGQLLPVEPSPYAEGLLRGQGALLDRLMAAALIEARSLERFELLAQHLPEPFAGLYRELIPSERGHAHLFVRLAKELYPATAVDLRLSWWLDREAAVMAGLEFAPRMHSGCP